MTSGRVWSARLAALVVAIIIPACQSTNPGAVGVASSLWISNGGIGGQPGGTLDWWNDPNTGTSNLYVADPYDVRTYTRPDIYILGLNHPLMTDIQAKTFPNIIFNEDRAMILLNQYRFKTFVDILGKPRPPTLIGTLTDHTGLRQNARAHSKHYATWHPTVALPQVNAEGDDAAGRLTKSGLTTAGLAQLLASGLTYRSGDDTAAYWIATYGATTGPIMGIGATHMAVGFWQLGGTTYVYYWTCLIARDPNTAVTLPTIPFGGPGF